MQTELLTDIDRFQAETGLSEHRIGILLARNGKLVGRLRAGGRIWPETAARIRTALAAERRKRTRDEAA